MKKRLLIPGAVLLLFACKTVKKADAPVTYSFTVSIREKYCSPARMDEALMRETEREKTYAGQLLYLAQKGSKDTLSYTTGAEGRFLAMLPEGTYFVFLPEKHMHGTWDHLSRCRDWKDRPDTTLLLDRSQTAVGLRLYRTCNPCGPAKP